MVCLFSCPCLSCFYPHWRAAISLVPPLGPLYRQSHHTLHHKSRPVIYLRLRPSPIPSPVVSPSRTELIHAWPLLESTLDLDFPTPRKPRALSLAIQPIYASPAGIHFTSVFVFLYATLGHHVLSVQLIAQSSRQLDITAPQWWTFGTMSVTTKIPRIWTRPATVVFCLLVPCFSRALRCVTI